MSIASNDLGRAYEYSCITQLYERISVIRPVRIIENSSLISSQNAWNRIDISFHEKFIRSATAVVETLFQLEPLICESGDDVLELRLQGDAEGELGDVRDCIILRNGISWEIGLSIKHNHFAVKHSRLAKRLDFGYKWFELPCSEEYWDDVNPIFNYLEEEKEKGTKWSDLPNKQDDIYVPLLNAFLSEILRSNNNNKDLPKKMVEYLIGKYDFYKVISIDRKRITQVQPYNLHGTLNQHSKTRKAAKIIPALDLPTRIVSAEFKPNSKTTVEIYFNEGWSFSFRIHSAETLVQPSLKFDIQLTGVPASIIALECSWE